MILCILIIAISTDLTVSLPISNIKDESNVTTLQNSLLPVTRFPRQVVQPKWLNFGREPPVDPKVHVNQQALSEAAEIRKTIQKAVKEGTYVVTDEEQNSNKTTEPFVMPASKETKTDHSLHGFPNWFTQTQKLWQNWTHNLFKGLHQ